MKLSSGSVFHQRYRGRDGQLKETRTWYVRYYVQGKPVTLPAETEDYDEAVQFLRRKMSATSSESDVLPERVKMAQLFDLLLDSYRTKGRHSLRLVNSWLRPGDGREEPGRLRAWFGSIKAKDVTSALIRRYTYHRQQAKPRPANATINRELAYVRRALNLGAMEDPPLVTRIPHFEMLPESDPREGILSHDQYKAVRDSLPPYARIALVIGYHTGARKGEIASIRIDAIDLKAGRILIRRATTKNGHPRYLPIYGDMAAELEMAIAGLRHKALTAGSHGHTSSHVRKASEPGKTVISRKRAGHKTGTPHAEAAESGVTGDDPQSKECLACPYLLQHEGRRVRDFRKSWATACELAGIPDQLFHDLRRTAVTNMIEAGFSEKEAMEISGHKTRAVFDRYHIVSERRLKDLAVRLGQHMQAKDAAAPEEKARTM